ncbi:polyribonucleotide nucleotidyltransferase [Candidatus Microgenomates bacterium]|nr:MAG: polyribonucleotide nucleotidyltransferase [Candidatus Microgenomates bacterium]
MKVIEKSIEIGGRTMTFSTGVLAPQASCAVLATYGGTAVLATVVSAPLRQELDYFPLSVEYQERLYAGGRIKGSRWVKREGRPTDEEILKGRLIDRSIRPLFPSGYQKDVQVIATVLSVDLENDPAVVAPLAVSAALHASSIPWDGPVSVLNVGVTDGKFMINPTDAQAEKSDMELFVSSTDKAIVMIEAGASEVSEEDILSGIEFSLKEGKKVIKFIEEFAKAVGNKKEKYEGKEMPKEVSDKVKKLVGDKLLSAVEAMAHVEGGRATEYDDLILSASAEFEEEEWPLVTQVIEKMKKELLRGMILSGKRIDGRKLDEVRNLYSKVGVLPRTHGSAIFQRGATQALTVATLGSTSMGQLIETAEGEEEKRYIHHYVMAPFSTGETGRVGSPGRREIGHGALAERALMPVIPSAEAFPYAIRLVSEILSSNGSTSMASTCGSTLSLMDAGVPISAPVSGIAMGLVIESEKKYSVMTDIAGIEDFNGDMDFKVAGTAKGITALQLDVKTLNLTHKILVEAMKQAKIGRAHILSHMLETISEPRTDVSSYAPKIKTIKIDPEKIGEVIGPGGKMIKRIIAETGAQVDVNGDDGTVNISGSSEEIVNKAIEWIEGMTRQVQAGEIYEGEVKRMQSFGAFVEVLPNQDGLLHVSDMSEEYVANPEDVVKLGDHVTVRVKEIDSLGRINLSMILDPSKEKEKPPRRDNRGGGGRRDDRRGGGRRDFRDRRNSGGGDRRSSGPHFPKSRLMAQTENKRFSR